MTLRAMRARNIMAAIECKEQRKNIKESVHYIVILYIHFHTMVTAGAEDNCK